MKKSIAILLTVIVVIVGVWLADSYWVFTGESLNYATWQLLVGFFVFMLFAVSSLVSFYRTAIKKHIARTIINLFLALLVFSFAFSASINMVNSAIFNMLHGGNNNMMGTSFMKSTTICGHALNKGDGLFRVSNAYTEENGQYFVVAFCPSIVYKTDQVMTDKSLMDALKESKQKEESHE